MKAHQKWDLLVLNSKGFVNFVMSNLRNFEKFDTLNGSGTLCRQSLCRQSLCRQSLCRQSLCRQVLFADRYCLPTGSFLPTGTVYRQVVFCRQVLFTDR